MQLKERTNQGDMYLQNLWILNIKYKKSLTDPNWILTSCSVSFSEFKWQ